MGRTLDASLTAGCSLIHSIGKENPDGVSGRLGPCWKGSERQLRKQHAKVRVGVLGSSVILCAALSEPS
jgi:hypothetical protein